MPRITSRRHPLVARFRRLARRHEPGAVLLDGEHLVADALAAGLRVEVLVTDGSAPALARQAQGAGAAVYQASAAVLEVVSPVRSPTGVVAIATWSPVGLAPAFDAGGLALGLVGVQDPGNAGSTIRSADALGASAVLALDGTADPGSWRALRGAMGSTFRVPVARASTREALDEARRRRWTVAATATGGGCPLQAARLTRPLLVLVGNEGAGLDEAVLADADERLTVPMRAGVDSLNVAVTASLVLWEAARRQDEASTPR